MPNSNGNGYCDESLRLIRAIRAIRVIRGQKIAFQTTDVTDDPDRIANAIGGQNSMGNLIHKEFVLAHYVAEGVSELDQKKLPPLLRLRYSNSMSDAVADLGKPEDIGRIFAGFQKFLYQGRL